MEKTYLRIPVFCLTLLGSDRHREMHKHLAEVTAGTRCHFEFVEGQFSEEDVTFPGSMAAAISASALESNGAPSTKGLNQLCRAMNVKVGMVRMMQRIIDLRCPWALAVQDDIRLMPDWRERCVQAINIAGSTTDRIAVTCVPKDSARDPFSIITKSYCTETASLVTPAFCHRYIRANSLTRAESDVAIKEIEGECVASFNLPAAYLCCTKSTIAQK